MLIACALPGAPLLACDLDAHLREPMQDVPLLKAVESLAEVSGCRIVLAPRLDAAHRPVSVARGLAVGDALDQLSIELDLNWRELAGNIEIAGAQGGAEQTHESAALTIEADARAAAGGELDRTLIGQSRLPSERGVLIPRTHLADGRVEDDALRDYSTAVTRAPGVYSMAATDVIRGVSASRLSPSQRASLVSIDGVPLPAEAWLFNRPGLGLMRSFELTRMATGLALAYGAGAGDIAIGTRRPESDWHVGATFTDAPQLAPRTTLTTTGDFGVPGLRTSVGISHQFEAESAISETQPDVLQHRQLSARIEWQDPSARHQLSASVIDFANLDLGGAWSESSCGRDRCAAGAAVTAHGAALGWRWQATPILSVLASAASSDTRASFIRLGTGGQPIDHPPGYFQMRHADLRVDLAPEGRWGFSAGAAQARRIKRTFSPRAITITNGTRTSLGMGPDGPGTGALNFTSVIDLLTDLPQAFAEARYDDGERWEGHLGVRRVEAEAASIASSRDVSERNCRVVPGYYTEDIQTCTQVALDRRVRNARERRETGLWLGNFGLRRRFDDGQWVGLQVRDSFLASDLTLINLSPNGALERLRTTELSWHRELGDITTFELRGFHHDWRDRVANLNAPYPDALIFDSEIVGTEIEVALTPGENTELWANASVMRSRSSGVPEEIRDRAVRGAPDWSVGIGARHRFRNGIHVGGNFSHAAATWLVTSDVGIEAVPSRDLLDARIGYRRGRVDFSVWGTNLLDDDYVVDAYGRSVEVTPYHAYDRIVGFDVDIAF